MIILAIDVNVTHIFTPLFFGALYSLSQLMVVPWQTKNSDTTGPTWRYSLFKMEYIFIYIKFIHSYVTPDFTYTYKSKKKEKKKSLAIEQKIK